MPPKSKSPDGPAITTEDAAPLVGVEPTAPVEPAIPVKVFLSEGIRQELEVFGRAGDPATGGRFELDKETGKVTYTDRAGKVTEL